LFNAFHVTFYLFPDYGEEDDLADEDASDEEEVVKGT
jgi:hypothetical protein